MPQAALIRLFLLFLLIPTGIPAGIAAAGPAYPPVPHLGLTPGKLCTQPIERRYPERIAYCGRKVSDAMKLGVMRLYDERLGTKTSQMDRTLFTIDHHIPLCMGGSNDLANLWPQHRRIGAVTTSLEAKICRLMALGRWRQAHAVDIMRRVKQDLRLVPAVTKRVDDELKRFEAR